MKESNEAKTWYENQMKYRTDCHKINPATGCYFCAPQCPIITVKGKGFCLLNADQCDVRRLADCNDKYPYMHYDEAKQKADFWVDRSKVITVGFKRGADQ